MKSLFGFLALVATLLVGAAIAAPAVVKPMVVSAVEAASPFADQRLTVQVDLDAFDVLGGVVGSIHVTGTDLEREGVTIAALDVTASGVGIGDHTFASSEGSLDGVEIHLDDGTTLGIRSIGVTGPSTGLEAVAHFDAAQAIAFVEHAFAEQGVSVGEIQLADRGVSFVVFEQQVTVPLAVQDGALVVPDLLGGGTLELLVPQPDDRWHLTSVAITPASMEIHASVEPAALVAAG